MRTVLHFICAFVCVSTGCESSWLLVHFSFPTHHQCQQTINYSASKHGTAVVDSWLSREYEVVWCCDHRMVCVDDGQTHAHSQDLFPDTRLQLGRPTTSIVFHRQGIELFFFFTDTMNACSQRLLGSRVENLFLSNKVSTGATAMTVATQ